MEKTETINMDEKIHYEIRFVETEDGYRLEAKGDKRMLKRLGIGPNMLRRGRSGHRRHRGFRFGPRRRFRGHGYPRPMNRNMGRSPDMESSAPGSQNTLETYDA